MVPYALLMLFGYFYETNARWQRWSNFGRSKGGKAYFNDVAGVEEAKEKVKKW